MLQGYSLHSTSYVTVRLLSSILGHFQLFSVIIRRVAQKIVEFGCFTPLCYQVVHCFLSCCSGFDRLR